jgi:hypothetical protein
VEDFDKYVVKKNVSFVANYKSSPRLYKVTLYDEDGVTILFNKDILHYGETIQQLIDRELSNEKNKDPNNYLANTELYKLTYNYKKYTPAEENDHKRYVFKGWRTSDDYSNGVTEARWSPSEILDYATSGNFVVYATYELEDALTNPTNELYFNFGYYTPNQFDIGNLNLGRGLCVDIKDLYRSHLQGSITLPSYYNGSNIRYVGNFNKMSKITDVYFLNDNEYYGITNKGFNASPKLTNVYLPKTEKFIYLGEYSFEDCRELTNIDLEGNNKLSDYIEVIGANCFASSSSGSPMKVHIAELPYNLNTLSA